MTIQDVIDKGYKPGMRIKCAATQTDEGTVAPVNEWRVSIPDGKSIVVGHDDDGDTLFAYDGGTNKWATVITPAPSKGLQEGDAVECSPAMRAAIIELAMEFGMARHVNGLNNSRDWPCLMWWKSEIIGYRLPENDAKPITPEEFIARMRVTPSTKANKDCSFRLSYEKGAVKIGDVLLSNDVYRSIAKGLQD